MGEQLELFGNKPVKPAQAVAFEPAQEGPSDAASETLPGQMGLFEDRLQRATEANKALQRFDMNAAAKALREAVRLYPQDASLRGRAELVTKLASLVRRERAKTTSPARALQTIEAHVPPFLLKSWHCRVAELVEEEGGPGAVLDGTPAGLHWLRAQEPVRAEASLRATLERNPSDSKARGYLADALFAQERVLEARQCYRDALSASPSDVDIRNAADVTVRDLPALAEEVYELPGNGVEWAAAIGLLDDVFLPPSHLPDDWLAPAVLKALPPGVQFYRWHLAEKLARDDAQRIGCRRAMKALSPCLMKELLERM